MGTWAALVLVCLSASVALVYPPVTKYELFESGLGGPGGDVGHYVRMYQGVPLAQIQRPFRYRVFTPLLARHVPDVPHGLLRYFDMSPDKLVKYHFGMANLIGLTAAGLLMFALGAALGFTSGEAILATFLFYTSFPVVNYGGTPMVEAWGYAFLLLGLVAALRRSHPGLFVASLFGMLAKETTILLVPAVLLLPDRPARKATALLALFPGILVYALFRLVLYPGGAGSPSDVATSLSDLAWRLSHGPYLAWILFDGGTAFGLLWPLAALGAWCLRGSPRAPLSRLAWLIPMVLLVPFVIGSNVGRIWFYAFPAMIPLAVVGLGRLLPGLARTPAIP